MKFSEKKRVQCASGVVTTGCGKLSGVSPTYNERTGRWEPEEFERASTPAGKAAGNRAVYGDRYRRRIANAKPRCKKGTRRVGGKCRRKGKK